MKAKEALTSLITLLTITKDAIRSWLSILKYYIPIHGRNKMPRKTTKLQETALQSIGIEMYRIKEGWRGKGPGQ